MRSAAVLPRDAPTSSVRFVHDLERHGERPALLAGAQRLSYRELAGRVRDVAERLGDPTDDGRRLVLLRAEATVESVVGYLAALLSGHPVLVVPSGREGAAEAAAVDGLIDGYDPDLVLGRDLAPVAPSGPDSARWAIRERRSGSGHRLHPELALLLSTSGSTGSPKLVRLSKHNLQANAEAIAEYLGIGPDDRAITSLPLHYSYGLSVLHSHLLRGASVVLTDRSVTDPAFWETFRAVGATSFAGVPYTFELLERSGFADLDLPSLRYVTSAGGRLDPDRAARFAALGQRRGWSLFVMYGQTEATARIAYLPPSLTLSHPHAVGVAIPGGTLRIDPVPGCAEPGTGELVYTGPNVMLGYAQTPADLALGRTVHELRTGDLGRVRNGLFEVIGRRSRIAKVFGARIDLDHLETCLAQADLPARCVATDDRLVVAVSGAAEPGSVRRHAAQRCGVPERVVRVVVLDPLPRLANGKVDYPTIAAAARDQPSAAGHDRPTDEAALAGADVRRAELRAVLSECLGRDDVTDDSTFAALGGDSLSYVEVSVRFEDLLGDLPADWHRTPVRQLAAASAASLAGAGPLRASWLSTRSVETSVLLRAVGIVLVVGSHTQLFSVVGGAHLLLGVAGYNVARFQLAPAAGRDRLRRLLGSARRVAVPTATWVAAVSTVAVLTEALPGYGVRTLLLLNGALGPWTWGPAWHFWFVECLVYILLGLAVLLSAPALSRMEARHPFAVALSVTGCALAARYGLEGGEVGIYSAPVVLWLFALGWTAARATTTRRRLVVSALAVASVPGFFGDPSREALVIAGLLLLTWVGTVRVPQRATRPLAVLASSSLYIYLTHWQVFPPIAGHSRALAVAVSVAVGVSCWHGVTLLASGAARLRRAARRDVAGRRPWRLARTASPL